MFEYFGAYSGMRKVSGASLNLSEEIPHRTCLGLPHLGRPHLHLRANASVPTMPSLMLADDTVVIATTSTIYYLPRFMLAGSIFFLCIGYLIPSFTVETRSQHQLFTQLAFMLIYIFK